jgi:hypothetical protein
MRYARRFRVLGFASMKIVDEDACRVCDSLTAQRHSAHRAGFR